MDSMTSYAAQEVSNDSWNVCVEIRTLNHRYLDITLSLPSYLRSLEMEIKKRVQKTFSRGKIEIYISMKEEIPVDIRVNSRMAESLHQTWEENLKSWIAPPSFSDLVQIEGSLIITPQRNLSLYAQCVLQTLDHTLAECKKLRQQEGKTIQKEMLRMMQELSTTLERIKAYLPEIERTIIAQTKKLAPLVEGSSSDEADYAAALIARSSVTEEVQRLEEHFRYFLQLIHDSAVMGKKLDFLCQEILRELNTMSAKLPHSPSQQLGVQMKCIIEDLREMAKNIE